MEPNISEFNADHLKFNCLQGQFSTDSSEVAFVNCGIGCAKQIYNQAHQTIIEPVMNVEVSFPLEFGDKVNKYLFEKHADIIETDEDNLVSRI